MMLFCYFTVISVLAIISCNIEKKKQKELFFVCCIVTFFLTGLRWNYGGDWDTYYSYYKQIKKLDFQVSFEYGWVILSTITKKISDNYILFQFVIATLIFYCTYKYIGKLSPAPLVSYLVLISSTFCGIGYVRTMVATFILMLGIYFTVKKEQYSFVFCVICAGLIHTSAFIAFPTYWVYHSKIKYRYWILIFIISTTIFYILGAIILRGISFLGPYIEYKINKYISGQEAGELYGAEQQSVGRAIWGHIIKKIFLLSFVLLFLRRDIIYNKNSLTHGLLNIYIFSSIFYCSMIPIALQFSRMCGYFECVDIILFAIIFNKLKGSDRYIFLFILIIFSAYRLAGKLIGYELYYNYHTVLSKHSISF